MNNNLVDDNSSLEPQLDPQKLAVAKQIEPKEVKFKKIYFFIFILTFLVLGSAYLLNNYYFKKVPNNNLHATTLSPTPTTILTTHLSSPSATVSPTNANLKYIHPYPYYGADPAKPLTNTHIISLLFVPKDITTTVPENWIVNLNKIDEEIKDFFEKQFDHKINITYEVLSSPIKGEKNLEEYTASTLATEAENSTKTYEKSNAYNIWTIYLVRDEARAKNVQEGSLGGLAAINTATEYEYWLDDDALDDSNPYGIVGSAHEFGHALGIPHPWELPANVNHEKNWGNVPGDLMGYMNSRLKLNQLYLRDDVKTAMGL